MAISIGVLSLVFCWIPILGGVLAVVGLVLSGQKKNMIGLLLCVIGLFSAIIFAIQGAEWGREYERQQRADQFIREWNRAFK